MKIKTNFGGENIVTQYPPFVKYPKIPYVEDFSGIWGQEGYVFEKLDGSLSQVRNTEKGLVGGSKSNYLTGGRVGFSEWFQTFLKWMRKNKSLNALPKDIILFGEWLVPVTVEYDPSKIDKFYFIDLGFKNENSLTLFDYNEACDYLAKWKIKDVQILDPITKDIIFNEDLIKSVANNRLSALRTGGIEGVILKDYRNQQFAKCLNYAYSEIRNQEKDLEAQYVNPPRVKKALIRLKEDKGLTEPSLQILATEIARNIKEESGLSFHLEAVKGVIRARQYYDKR